MESIPEILLSGAGLLFDLSFVLVRLCLYQKCNDPKNRQNLLLTDCVLSWGSTSNKLNVYCELSLQRNGPGVHCHSEVVEMEWIICRVGCFRSCTGFFYWKTSLRGWLKQFQSGGNNAILWLDGSWIVNKKTHEAWKSVELKPKAWSKVGPLPTEGTWIMNFINRFFVEACAKKNTKTPAGTIDLLFWTASHGADLPEFHLWTTSGADHSQHVVRWLVLCCLP